VAKAVQQQSAASVRAVTALLQAQRLPARVQAANAVKAVQQQSAVSVPAAVMSQLQQETETAEARQQV
jgi:L-lysine 2,3-aminomutase